jgi:phytoene dehydrogenase-like protein
VKKSSAYDVVIIGAGIGGLVCGCYLAKAGMKVLIAEQHYKPGGYCTSFIRNGFTFDAAAHSFGGYREGGLLRKIFHEISLDKEVEICRSAPSDIVITPEHRIAMHAHSDETVDELSKAFPHEHIGISKLFNALATPNPVFFASLRKITFSTLLDRYFADATLKSILSFPLFGNGGLPSSALSAFVAAKIYSEFLLDGGYYPTGGMQMIPDVLAQRFKQYGGELLLKCLVERIIIKDGKVAGIYAKRKEFIPACRVVSCCDARSTFMQMIGRQYLPNFFIQAMDRMVPSLSMFVLYLGLQGERDVPVGMARGANSWILNEMDLEKIYAYAIKGDMIREMDNFMARLSPDSKSLLAFVSAPYRDKLYWANSKKILQDYFIAQIEKYAFPGLKKSISFIESATPHTLYRYTRNYQGAAYGWAARLEQTFIQDFRKPSFVEGLHLTGHWTTHAQGIPGVMYVGCDTAKHLLRLKS